MGVRSDRGGPATAIVAALRKRRQTQAELVESTELSRVTVHDKLQPLLESGLVTIGSGQVPTGGRPASIYEINRHYGRVLVADVGSSVMRIGIADLAGHLLRIEMAEVEAVSSPDAALRVLRHAFIRLAETEPCRVVAAGIGIPVAVDPGTYEVVGAGFPTWAGADVRAWFADLVDGPIVVGRDVTFMAIGELRVRLPDVRTAVMLKVGMGVGCAVLMDGVPLVGDHGRAFEIGHLPYAGSKARCECRRIGCLETAAGGRAIVKELSWQGVRATSSMDIMSLAVAGSPLVRDLLFETGRRIGAMVAPIVDLLDPGAVIVGGNLVAFSDLVIQGLRESLVARPASQVISTPTIMPSMLGGEAGLRGAAFAAVDEVLSPSVVAAP